MPPASAPWPSSGFPQGWKPRLVAFDLDDTLYPEITYARSGLAAAACWARAHLGMDGLLEAALAAHAAGIRGRIFDAALTALGKPVEAAVVARLVEVYRSHTPVLSFFPEVPAVLKALRPHCLLAVITDGCGAVQRAKVKALALEACVDRVVFTDDYGPGFAKPHPRAFADVAASLGDAPGECLYVGDNPVKDFLGARRAGWRSVRVRRAVGEHIRAEPVTPDQAPDAELSSLTPVAEWLAPSAAALPPASRS